MPVNPCFLSQVTNQEFEKSLTPEERSAFWRYAKSIGADKGVDHATVISQMASDFNLPPRLIAQALKGPKSLYRASEEVRARQKASAQFLAQNAKHLESLDRTGAQRFINFANEGTRRALLFQHGPVPPVTHAIDVATTNPVQFLKMYARGFAALSKTAHEQIMADLQNPVIHPYYKIFKDAGAPIGPQEIEGFQKTGWAGRSMDTALKPLRYNLMAAKWERLGEAERTPEAAKALAIEYAHATGGLVQGEPIEKVTRGVRKLFLAPQLTPSKWAKTAFDPIETAKTFERLVESKMSDKVRPPTPEERMIAWNRTTRAARYLGGTLGALAINKAILQSQNSQQKVNLDDPIRSDFLAFKGGGKMYRMRGSIEVIALLAKLAALGRQKYKYGQQSPEEAFAKYGEYKLTPGIGLGKELLTGKDVFGRPVPWSPDLGSAKFPRKNVMEFAGEHGPIFVGHFVSAFHEVLRDQGVDTRDSMNVIRALQRDPQAVQKAMNEALLEGGAEFFGVNIQPDRYIGKDEAGPTPARRPQHVSTPGHP